MKRKKYVICEAKGVQVGTIHATCITKAARQFIDTLDRPYGGTYSLDSRVHAKIRYLDNNNALSDFVVYEDEK